MADWCFDVVRGACDPYCPSLDASLSREKHASRQTRNTKYAIRRSLRPFNTRNIPCEQSPTARQSTKPCVKKWRAILNVILIGEDVGVFGGVWGVSGDLVQLFGEDRVRDTPISEAGHRRRGAGRGHDGPAAHRRDHVRRFPARGRRSARQPARQGALHERRQGERAGHRAHHDGRARLGRGAALAVARGLVHERARPQDRGAHHPGRRQGPAADRDPGRGSGALFRAQDALCDQGRGAGGSRLLCAVRPGRGARAKAGT